MRRLFILAAAIALWLVLTAAAPASTSSALAIAGVVGVLLPLVLKFVPAAGHYMIAITLIVSLLVAVIAEVVTGELVLSDLSKTDYAALFTIFMSVWGLSQVVYATLAQSPKT